MEGGAEEIACNAAVNSTDLLYKHSTKYVTQSDIGVGVSMEVGDGLLVLNLVIFRPSFSPQRQSGVVRDSFVVGVLGNILPQFPRHQIRETTKTTGAFFSFASVNLAVYFILDIAHLNIEVQREDCRNKYEIIPPG